MTDSEYDYTFLRVLSVTFAKEGRFGVIGECIRCNPPKEIRASNVNKIKALVDLRKLFRIHEGKEHVEGN